MRKPSPHLTLTRLLRTSQWLVLVCAMGVSSNVAVANELSRAARIQAVLVLRIVKFVSWPPDALARQDGLQICTLGDSPTHLALQALQGQKVREQEIKVRKLVPSPSLDTSGCHVLYVAASQRAAVSPAWLYDSGSRALLTISDMPDFGQRGGIISLVQQDNKMGFEVYMRYARANGLQIGSLLLELARSVE